MPEINIQTYCGICGTGTCRDTSVEDNHVTITCHNCKKKIDNLEAALDEQKAHKKWINAKIQCKHCRFNIMCNCRSLEMPCPFDEGYYEGQQKLLSFLRLNSDNPRERMHYEFLLSQLENTK